MSITVQWQQATKYPASNDRAVIRALGYPDSDTSTRDGVLTLGGLTPAHTTGMSVKVSAGQAMVAGYLVTVDPAETVTLDVGGAQKRTDLVVLRVYDESEGDTNSEGAVEVVKGPAGGAVPAVPARSLLIAQAAVTATASTLDPGDLTDHRQWTTGRGGILYMPGALDDDPPSWMDDGQAVFDGGKIGVKTGAAWKIARREGDTTPVADGGTGRSSLASGSYLRGSGGAAVEPRTPAQVWDDIVGKGGTDVPVSKGGTGRHLWTGDRYLRSDSTGTVIDQFSPSAVLDDIGAAVSRYVASGSWNDLTKPGVYYVSNIVGRSGTYIALVSSNPSGSVVGQVAWNLSAGKQFQTYYREYFGGAWSDWATLGNGDTGWLNCSMASGISGQVKARVLNGVVYLSGVVSGSFSGGELTVGTLPGSIPRPPNVMSSAVRITSVHYSTVRIDTSGVITGYSSDSNLGVDGTSYPAT